MKKRASRNGVKFGGKIKTEHSIVEGLFEPLQSLAQFPEVHSIIPGRIMRRGSALAKSTITFTIPTTSGWKALGKSKGSTQEIFIVTDQPDAVKKKWNAMTQSS
jgi:hypothetical protein